MIRHSYGWEFTDGLQTTAGNPNTDNGRYKNRLSIAGHVKAFTNRDEREAWVEKGCDSSGGRRAVTLSQARYLLKGMPKTVFEKYITSVKLGLMHSINEN